MLASDGVRNHFSFIESLKKKMNKKLWEVMENQEVGEMVMKNPDPNKACKELVRTVDSRCKLLNIPADNLTSKKKNKQIVSIETHFLLLYKVIIVVFNHSVQEENTQEK